MPRGRFGIGIGIGLGALALASVGRAGVVGADWAFDGDQTGAAFGEDVALVGDVNGDGYSDVIVGAPLWGNIFQPESGRAFLFLGSPSGLESMYEWTVAMQQPEAHFGGTVAGAGDVNGDGFDDVLVAAADYDNAANGAGRVHLYLGSATGLSTTPDWVAEGDQSAGAFGLSMAGIGDANGDGFDDVAIGAPRYNNPEVNEGRVYIYYGASSGLPAAPSTTREPNEESAFFGTSIACAGDVNADGIDDVIIGAYAHGTNAEGGAFVYLGTLFGMAQSPVWVGEGNQDNAYYGNSVAGVGDVNGDGYGDVMVGSFLYDNGFADAGAAFVYFGRAAGVNSAAAWSMKSTQANSNLGASVAPAGDMNGDGYADILVGAPYYTITAEDEGIIAVFYGSETGPTSGSNLLFFGGQAGAFFGASVSSAGDVNADGYTDIFAGAYCYDDGYENEGEVFAFYGKAGELPGLAAWKSGGALSDSDWGSELAYGDFNGDGFDDLAAGSPFYDGGLNSEGLVWVSYGAQGGPTSGYGWSQEGEMAYHWYGSAVAAADLNGDGYDDLLVGAPSKPFPEDGGNVYVYPGSELGLNNTPEVVLDSEEDLFGATVVNAGDVNGDGYHDVLISVSTESYFGRVYLYNGSETGISPTPSWSYTGQDGTALLGSSAAGGGDVNGDGYSDFAVAALSGNGRVLVFHGGPDGPASTASWVKSGTVYGSLFGQGLAFGDIDADGHSDLVIGAPHHLVTHEDEGAVYAFFGSPTGLLLNASWSRSGGMAYAELGMSVSSSDFDNDGRSDVVVAATAYTAGDAYEGKAYLYLAPLGPTPVWTLEGDEEEARIGTGLTSGGDANADGFPELAISSPNQSNGILTFGKVSVFFGGEGGGVLRGLRQTHADGTALVSLLGQSSSDEFRIGMDARTAFGRDRIRVEYEIESAGDAFDGVGIVSTDWLDTGAPSAGIGSMIEFSDLVTGAMSGDALHWRMRVVTESPWFPSTPWFTPTRNGAGEWDLRVGGGSTSDAPEMPEASGARLAMAGPNPFGARAYLVLELADAAPVSVRVYDTSGRFVASLHDGWTAAGTHALTWDGRSANGAETAAGVYYARLQTGQVEETVHLIRVR